MVSCSGSSVTSGKSSGLGRKQWSAVVVADREALEEDGTPASISSKTYSDFAMAGDGSVAHLVAGFADSTGFRRVARKYYPFTLAADGATEGVDMGWASAGDEFLELDSTPSTFDVEEAVLGLASDGSALAAFSSSASFYANGSTTEDGWSYSDPTPVDTFVGDAKGAAWDDDGNSYLAYITGTDAYLQRAQSGFTWDGGNGTQINTPGNAVGDLALVSDGYFGTAVWTEQGNQIRSRIIDEGALGTTRTLFTGDTVQTFSAAADSSGNVLVVYYAGKPSVTSCDSDVPGTLSCQYRVFASVRNVSETWVGPTQLDTDLAIETTSAYQDVGNGTEFPKPAVVHVGDGKFLVAYTFVDYSDSSSKVSSVYVRSYQVGVGWNTEVQVLDTQELLGITGSASDHYRGVNGLKLVSDGQGNAVLLLHKVLEDGDSATQGDRLFGYQSYHYTAATGWTETLILDEDTVGLPGCPVTSADCRAAKLEAAVFTSGEAIWVMAAPESAGSSSMRLFTSVYLP